MKKYMKILSYYYMVFPLITYDIVRFIRGCYIILDLGCGSNSTLKVIKERYKVGVDLYIPYLYEAKKRKTHQQYILTDARQLPLKTKSFDAIIALDILEHLTKKEGYILLESIEKITKKMIIILTPNGYISQENRKNSLQRHRSGWTVKDLTSLGFRVLGANGLRSLRGEAATIKYRPKILWNIICEITQKVVRHRPYLAYHLLGVKVLTS